MKYQLLMEQYEPRKLHFPSLYAKSLLRFSRASELDVTGFIRGLEESFCGLIKTIGDVINNFGQVKPRCLQTLYQKRQKRYNSRDVVTPLINPRALLVTMVAPSKRPDTLNY